MEENGRKEYEDLKQILEEFLKDDSLEAFDFSSNDKLYPVS